MIPKHSNKLFFKLFPGLLFLLMISGCDIDSHEHLGGVWVVKKVETSFDASRMNPEMLRQFVELQKKRQLEFGEGGKLNYKFRGQIQTFSWELRADSIWLTGADGIESFFGIREAGYIIQQTDSPVGEIHIIYEASP